MIIYLAGVSSILKEAIQKKIYPKYILESFIGLANVTKEYIKTKHCKKFMLDSGAFTYLKQNTQKSDWTKYIENYIAFINEYDVELFFELDIDIIIGLKKVQELRRMLEKETGKRCIPVWHRSRGKKNFEKLVEEYDYISIGGLAIGHIKRTEYKYLHWFIDKAHKNKCKIHGLGFTGVNNMMTYNFDSVDSTNWLSARFPSIVTYYFNGAKIIDVKNQDYLNMRDSKDRVKIKKKDLTKCTLHSLQEWMKYAEYMNKGEKHVLLRKDN